MNKEFVDYKTAKGLLKQYVFSSSFDWHKQAKEIRKAFPIIPSRPWEYYRAKGEWVDWKDFLSIKTDKKPAVKKDVFENLFGDSYKHRLNIEETEKHFGDYPSSNNNETRNLFGDPTPANKKSVVRMPDGKFTTLKTLQNTCSETFKKARKEFISYSEAKEVLKPFKLISSTDWEKKSKTIRSGYPKLPSQPAVVYKALGEWVSWEDFLSCAPIVKKVFYSYSDTKKILEGFNLTSSTDWEKNSKYIRALHPMIPSDPYTYYKSSGEWVSWLDFVSCKSNNKSNKVFLSYDEAKKVLKPLGLKTSKELQLKFAKLGLSKKRIPARVVEYYKSTNEWVDWQNFLSLDKKETLNTSDFISQRTDRVIKGTPVMKFLPANHGIDINNPSVDTYKEDQQTTTNGFNIPIVTYDTAGRRIVTYLESTPKSEYSEDISEDIDENISYEEAKEIAIRLGVKSSLQWTKIHPFITKVAPDRPDKYYNEWVSWDEFLFDTLKSYTAAKEVVKNFNILTKNMYDNFVYKNKDIINLPENPEQTFKSIWKGWYAFLN